MARWRSPELEALFGCPLDDSGLTEEVLNRLVLDQVRENEQLDFKGDRYRPTQGPRQQWTDEQEFAKDVAAFANHRGGVLLIGLAETNQVASKCVPIMTSTPEAEERRLRQALSNYLAPLAETIFIPIAASPDGWYHAIVVPPSRRAPHSVLNHPGDLRTALRYPVRHGADTTWLTESEVAERYRRRALGAVDERERAERVIGDGCRALRRARSVWLYIACVPEVPVTQALDSSAVQEVERWHHQGGLTSPLGDYFPALGRGIAAPGRVTFTGSLASGDDDETQPRDAYAELHVDGASFVALPILERTSATTEDEGIGERTLVDDSIILNDLALRWCARQVGAWGTATVTVGLHDADAPFGSTRDLVLVHYPGNSPRRVHGTRRLTEPPKSTTTADLAAVDTVQQRLSVAHGLLAGLLQFFGIAEPRQINPDGSLNALSWGTSHRTVQAWGRQHDVEFTPVD